MTDTGGPPAAAAARMQLGAELRRLRDLAGISGRDLAAQVGVSQSTLSRIEAGGRVPSLPEVSAWASATGADERTRAYLARLAEAAMTAIAPWRSALGGRAHFQDDAQQLENASQTVRCCTHSLIPGLLQTAAYARALFAHFTGAAPGHDDAAALAARLRRQEALHDPAKRFEFLITEAALRWAPGPGTTAAQCSHLASIATLENVWVGLLPLNSPAGPFTDFTVYEPAGEDGAVTTVELPHARLVLADATDVEIYRAMFSRWQSGALVDADAQHLLRQIATDAV